MRLRISSESGPPGSDVRRPSFPGPADFRHRAGGRPDAARVRLVGKAALANHRRSGIARKHRNGLSNFRHGRPESLLSIRAELAALEFDGNSQTNLVQRFADTLLGPRHVTDSDREARSWPECTRMILARGLRQADRPKCAAGAAQLRTPVEGDQSDATPRRHHQGKELIRPRSGAPDGSRCRLATPGSCGGQSEGCRLFAGSPGALGRRMRSSSRSRAEFHLRIKSAAAAT